MLAALLFAAHAGTVSVTVPCSSAKDALAALGKQLGLDLRPSGSVNSDFFLVYAHEATEQELLDRVAKTLTATWAEKDGVRYLGRTHAQELEIQDLANAALRDCINEFLDQQPKPKPWSRDDALAYLRPIVKPDGSLGNLPSRPGLESTGPYRDLLVEFVRAVGADAFSKIADTQTVRFAWRPQGNDRALPPAFRSVAETVAQSVRAVGAAMRELGGGGQLGYGDVTPDSWAFTVNRIGRSLSVLVVYSGTNPTPFGYLSITRLTKPELFAPYLDAGAKYVPSPLAKSFLDSLLRTAKGPVRLVNATEDPQLLEWFEQGMPVDPLQLGVGDAVLQAIEKGGLNGVVVLPDFIAPFGGWYPMEGQSLQSLLANVLNASVVEVKDGWLTSKHSLYVGAMERFDRRAFAQFALDARKEGWQRIEPLAELASKCDGSTALFSALRLSEAINPLQCRYRMIGKERFDLLRLYASLPVGAKTSAKNGGVTWRLSEMPATARQILVESLKDKGLRKLPFFAQFEQSWNAGFTWAHVPGPGTSVVPPPDSVVEVRLDSEDRLTVPDKGEKGMYMAGLFTPVEAARGIVSLGRSDSDPEFAHDLDNLAVVHGERLLVTVTLPNGDSFQIGLTADSQNSNTQFSPYATLKGPLGDALREELRRLGG